MNIAIIDDSELVSQMIKTSLKPYGYIPDRITTKELRNTLIESYQIVIVSSSIRTGTQGSLVEDIRKENDSIPIIAIINKGNWKDKITLFDSGVDDVLEFPFPIKELQARIENIMSRPKQRQDKQYAIKDIVIDAGAKCVRRSDEEVDLRRKEYSILEYLARHKGRTVSRTELMDNIWDYRKITSSNTVDVHISNIRKKLNDKDLIRTVHGFGYKIDDE